MSKPTILIVEDEAIVAEALSQKLGRLGYEVCGIIALGEEPVVLARDRRPDLVLMDISLVGPMDGVDAAERIRGDCGALPSEAAQPQLSHPVSPNQKATPEKSRKPRWGIP